MSGKWKRVDPAEIKVGDRVRVVGTDGTELVGAVSRTPDGLNVGPYWFSTQASSWNIWYVRKPKPVKPEADKYDGHGVEHWHNRYEKQLAHSEQLQAANKNRRQKMQLLKKEAKDARAQVRGWESRYGVLSASFVESDYLHAETQAQLDDAMLTIAEKNTELANLRQVLADTQNATTLTRPDKPPVGAFFRVDRTGNVYRNWGVDMTFNPWLPPYQQVDPIGSNAGARLAWDKITEPGDTITLLDLVERDA